MTVVEALPMDIQEALYHYCKDDESLNDAFIRALRTELFRWHDLRKNPEDLPVDSGDGTGTSEKVLVQFESGNRGGCYYDFDLLGWFANGYPEEVKEIIAWSEIPKFEETKE